MTEANDSDRVERMLAHMDAIRRLRGAVRKTPEALVGLSRRQEVHLANCRRLVGELCGFTPAAEGLEIPAAGVRAYRLGDAGRGLEW